MSRWNGITVTLSGGEELRCEPATAERFSDLPAVLGERGGPGGCWCMFWRLQSADWQAGNPTQRKTAFADRLAESPPPGVLGYFDDRPVGWCAVAPRHEYPRMQSSPTFGPVDDTPSGRCRACSSTARRADAVSGLRSSLLRWRWRRPTEPRPSTPSRSRRAARAVRATSTRARPSMFAPLGFTEIARRKPERPIVRLALR